MEQALAIIEPRSRSSHREPQPDREDLKVKGAMKKSLDGWGRVWPEEDWSRFLRKRKSALPRNGRILEREMTESKGQQE